MKVRILMGSWSYKMFVFSCLNKLSKFCDANLAHLYVKNSRLGLTYPGHPCTNIFSATDSMVSGCFMIITIKMADEVSSSTKQHKNILIGVTGSVASIKLSKLVDELLILQPKVHAHCNSVSLWNLPRHMLQLRSASSKISIFLYNIFKGLLSIYIFYSHYCNSQISKLLLQITPLISLMRIKFLWKFSETQMSGR